MFLERVASIALVVGGLGAIVEVLSRAGVDLPRALDPPGDSLVSRLGRRADERPVFVVLAVLALTVLFLFPFVDAALRSVGAAPPFGYWDFSAYTSALHRWQIGEPMYVTNEDGGYFGTYLYPPVFLFAIWPLFELLEFGTAAVAWQLASICFFWLALQPVIRALGHTLRLWERGLLLWLLAGFHPLLFSVKQGQISAFLAGLLALALYGLLRGERDDPTGRGARYASGACTAAVGAIKIVYGAVGAHLLADRRRFAGAAAAGGALLALSVGIFGLEAHLGYVDVLRWGKGGAPSPPWLWMRTYYHPLYALTPIAFPLRLLASGALAALALAASAGDADRELYAMGVAAMPLIAPTAYTYYLTALLPAVVLLVALELDRDGRPALPVLALLLCQFHAYGLKLVVEQLPALLPHPHAPVPILYGDALAVVAWLLQPGVWGALLLTGLAVVRVREVGDLPAWLRTGRTPLGPTDGR